MSQRTKEEATRLAKELKAMMKTKGWEIDVWKNMHWCYCIRSGWMTVVPTYDGTAYMVFLSENEGGSGDATGYWCSTVQTHTDPNVAVANRIASVEAALKERLDKIALVKKAYQEVK